MMLKPTGDIDRGKEPLFCYTYIYSSASTESRNDETVPAIVALSFSGAMGLDIGVQEYGGRQASMPGVRHSEIPG